jgi:hypothetical protein
LNLESGCESRYHSSMSVLNKKTIEDYQARTFRLLPGGRLNSPEEAIHYVNERGYIYFWPIKDVVMPSLWTAVAGDRPVADAHDDPGHITWSWKDSLLGKRRWYYAKILRKKATIISMQAVKYFYALSENYGAPESDYLTTYEQGRMTQEAKLIYEALLDEGSLDTVALRRKTHLTSRASDYRFNRGLVELQQDFKVLPVGVTRSGGWNYAFAYDIVTRHLPEIPEQARFIGEKEARKILVELYLESVGAAEFRDLKRLFGWKPKYIQTAVNQLAQEGFLRQSLQVERQPGEWLALTRLLDGSYKQD